jgi:penicillin V acylase-like amidase (Ntn superfamily)
MKKAFIKLSLAVGILNIIPNADACTRMLHVTKDHKYILTGRNMDWYVKSPTTFSQSATVKEMIAGVISVVRNTSSPLGATNSKKLYFSKKSGVESLDANDYKLVGEVNKNFKKTKPLKFARP